MSESRSIYGNKMSFFLDQLSRGPSEVKGDGDRRGPGLPCRPLCLCIWDQAMVPLPTSPEPCTGRGPACGPVASAESPERAQGCGGRAQSRPSWKGAALALLALGLPGALAAHNFLLRHSALITQLCCGPAPEARLGLASPPPQAWASLLPLPRRCSQEAGCRLQLVSERPRDPALGPLPLPAAAHFPCCYQFLLTGRLGSRPWEWLGDRQC